MGTGPYGTTGSGMINGLKSLSRNCLDAVWDGSASYSEAKAEIDANRPVGSERSQVTYVLASAGNAKTYTSSGYRLQDGCIF